MSEDSLPTVTIRGNTTFAEAMLVIAGVLGFMLPWIMGVVLAPSWWQKILAVPFFPYAWYLTAERFMQMAGIIPQACL